MTYFSNPFWEVRVPWRSWVSVGLLVHSAGDNANSPNQNLHGPVVIGGAFYIECLLQRFYLIPTILRNALVRRMGRL